MSPGSIEALMPRAPFLQPETFPTEEATGFNAEVASILVVDDEPTIRESLVQYLSFYHTGKVPIQVWSAEGVNAARQALDERDFTLVLSDINMPDGDGFTVLNYARACQPKTRTALMTAYKVDDYIRLAKQDKVYNIIAKVAPFDFQELSNVVNHLLDPRSSFGLAQYLEADCAITTMMVESTTDIMAVFNALRNFFTLHKARNTNDLSTALIEALTNAVYHVARTVDGQPKYLKGQTIAQLLPDEVVKVCFGADSQGVGVSITDQGGRIGADDILYWLDRNLSGAGLMDTHGRGVFLMHTLVDRLIINLDSGQCTELIILDSFTGAYHANKPLYIHSV